MEVVCAWITNHKRVRMQQWMSKHASECIVKRKHPRHLLTCTNNLYFNATPHQQHCTNQTESQLKCTQKHHQRQMEMDIISISFCVAQMTLVHLFSSIDVCFSFAFDSISRFEMRFRVRHSMTAKSLFFFCYSLTFSKIESVSNCCLFWVSLFLLSCLYFRLFRCKF